MSSVPEQAVLDAERAVLGAILAAGSLDLDAGHRVLDGVVATGLDPNHFYVASLGLLYGRMVDMREKKLPVDPVSVGYELERSGAESSAVARLHQLAYQITAVTPAPRWAAIVSESARRELSRERSRRLRRPVFERGARELPPPRTH